MEIAVRFKLLKKQLLLALPSSKRDELTRQSDFAFCRCVIGIDIIFSSPPNERIGRSCKRR